MRLRRVVVGLVVLVVVALAAVLVFANRLIDANRDRILAAAETAIGRPVRVGEIGARFFGRPGVRLSDVAIADDPAFGAEPFVRAQSATVLLALRPLLEGRIEISRIELQKPSVRLVRAADGRLNYATLGGGARAAEGGGGPGAPGTPAGSPPVPAGLAWVVAVFDIADGEVSYVDQGASPPRTTALKKIDLSASDIALDQPMQFDLRAALDAPDPNIRISGEVGPVSAPGGVAFAVQGTVGPLAGILPAVLDDIDLRGHARPEGLDVDTLAFAAFGGTVAGNASLPLVERGPFSFNAQVRGVSLQKVLPVVAPQLQRTIEGVAAADVDLQGVGNDPEVLRDSLRGTVSVDVADGILRDLNLLGEVVGRLTSMPGLTKLISGRVKPKYSAVLERPDTHFSSLALRLRLVERVVEVESARLDGEDFGATAEGEVRMPNQADLHGEILLSRRFSEEVAADVKESRLLFNADGQVALPFVYRGVIGQAKPQADLERLGTTVLKGRGKDLVDALLKGGAEGQGAMKSLGEGLRNLLGR